LVDRAHQHNVEHGVVGDEDVGRVFLHVPPAAHLSAIESGQVEASIVVLDRL
jgi:hypothetical protein